jgi:DNA-binding transcriptional ArsR family regulator
MRTDIYRAIADPTRRAMLDLLREGERPASALAAPFAMSRAAASQHLGVLLDCGLIDVKAVGRQRVYSLRREALSGLRTWVESFSAT